MLLVKVEGKIYTPIKVKSGYHGYKINPNDCSKCAFQSSKLRSDVICIHEITKVLKKYYKKSWGKSHLITCKDHRIRYWREVIPITIKVKKVE